jgi:hypothetical protein
MKEKLGACIEWMQTDDVRPVAGPYSREKQYRSRQGEVGRLKQAIRIQVALSYWRPRSI